MPSWNQIIQYFVNKCLDTQRNDAQIYYCVVLYGSLIFIIDRFLFEENFGESYHFWNVSLSISKSWLFLEMQFFNLFEWTLYNSRCIQSTVLPFPPIEISHYIEARSRWKATFLYSISSARGNYRSPEEDALWACLRTCLNFMFHGS